MTDAKYELTNASKNDNNNVIINIPSSTFKAKYLVEGMTCSSCVITVENGVKMVMVGHIAMPGLDDSNQPASFSHMITSGLLRNEWGFEGLIITDGMEMGGLTKSAWAGESAVRAIEAGADILLLPMDVEQTLKSVLSAVKSGRINEKRINQSVQRIWKMKSKMGLLNGAAQIPFSSLLEN